MLAYLLWWTDFRGTELILVVRIVTGSIFYGLLCIHRQFVDQNITKGYLLKTFASIQVFEGTKLISEVKL